MNTKRCQICWIGTTCCEFMGMVMCTECLSHRIEIGELDKFEKLIKKHGVPVDFHFFEKAMGCIPKLKSESEWQWWQDVARARAYEILDEATREIQRLSASEHDAVMKFNWMFERTMNTHRALLRLRIGFARLARDVSIDKDIQKDAKFWDRVRHTFIFRLNRFNKNLGGK